MKRFFEKLDRAHGIRGFLCILTAMFTVFFSTGICVAAESVADVPYDEGVDYDKPIVVSMGDSYSSGEGIEDFFGSELANEEKVQNSDWLAHRSKESWPGQLEIPGLGITGDHKDGNWRFVASSGATTADFSEAQEKDYSLGVMNPITDDSGRENGVSASLPPQLQVFDELQPNSVDYVTLTIGGNDMKFTEIVSSVFLGSSYLNSSSLTEDLAEVWELYFEEGGVRDRLLDTYMKVYEKAGSQAQIIVVGYPRLFDEGGRGFLVSKKEADEVNRAVSEFNSELEKLVDYCAETVPGMKISFVSVEECFMGHGSYSKDPWINPVWIAPRDEDLKTFQLVSSYSVHPNKEGARRYAMCVNEHIKMLEEQAGQNIVSTAKESDVVVMRDMPDSRSDEYIPVNKAFADSAAKLIDTETLPDRSPTLAVYCIIGVSVSFAVTAVVWYVRTKLTSERY